MFVGENVFIVLKLREFVDIRYSLSIYVFKSVY